MATESPKQFLPHPTPGDSFFPGGEIGALRSRCQLTEFERKKLAETESQCRLNLDNYFLALELFTAFLPAVFLRGRPSFGLATNASTSARNTQCSSRHGDLRQSSALDEVLRRWLASTRHESAQPPLEDA